MRSQGFAAVEFEPLEDRALFSTFTVTTNANSGPGSLRQAILDANAASTNDLIRFNISSGSTQIRPLSKLPDINGNLTIDGSSQPGYAPGKPVIELNGPLAGATTSGLSIKSGAVTVKGLSITSFKAAGIVIGGAGGCRVLGCNIGVDPSGKRARGNGMNAIVIAGSSGNLIGGKNEGDGNILAYNGVSGHSVTGGSTSPAIFVYGAAMRNVFYRNSIYNNHGFGIDLVSGRDSRGRLLKTPDAIPNPNDEADADTGPNGLQNDASLYFAGLQPGQLSVLGNFQSAPRRMFHIEMYSSPNAFQNTGPAQARTFVTSTDVTTDKTGFGQVSIVLSQNVPVALLSLTTTGPEGTSEISLPKLTQAGTVTGSVYVDKNLNGIKDSGEAGIAGATVYFDQKANGSRDLGEPFTTTDARGNYTFTDAQGGPERVRVDASALGYRVFSPTAGYYDRTLPSTRTRNLNFGLTTTGIIGGSVYNDANKNGKRDTNDAGLSAWTVYIDSNNNGKLDAGERSRVTNSRGNYQFANLAPRTYVVRIVGQTGFKVFSSAAVSTRLLPGATASVSFGVHAVG